MEVRCTFKPGSIIGGKFEIVKRLGEGSLGDDIYLCRQNDLKREVSVRILPQDLSRDKEMVQRFTQGIQLSAILQHPNILPAFEAGTHAGRAYMATAVEDGDYLSALIKREKRLKEDAAVAVALGLAEALDYAWTKGSILHRNIRPESVIVAKGGQPILADFGMAKCIGATDEKGGNMSITMVGFTIGNPDYMSPEQVSGESDLDCRSDIYCLGLVLYECLTGEPPFKSPSQIALMEMQLNKQHRHVKSLNHEISDACSSVVDKMLAKDRAARYQTYAELIDDLEKVLKRELPSTLRTAASEPAAAAQQQGKGAKRKGGYKPHPVVVAVVSMAIVLGVALGLVAMVQGMKAKELAEKLDRLGSMFDNAAASAKTAGESKKPAAFDSAIADFEIVREQAAGTDFEAKAGEEIAKLKAAKEAAIQEAKAKEAALKEQAEKEAKAKEAALKEQAEKEAKAKEAAAQQQAPAAAPAQEKPAN